MALASLLQKAQLFRKNNFALYLGAALLFAVTTQFYLAIIVLPLILSAFQVKMDKEYGNVSSQRMFSKTPFQAIFFAFIFAVAVSFVVYVFKHSVDGLISYLVFFVASFNIFAFLAMCFMGASYLSFINSDKKYRRAYLYGLSLQIGRKGFISILSTFGLIGTLVATLLAKLNPVFLAFIIFYFVLVLQSILYLLYNQIYKNHTNQELEELENKLTSKNDRSVFYSYFITESYRNEITMKVDVETTETEPANAYLNIFTGKYFEVKQITKNFGLLFLPFTYGYLGNRLVTIICQVIPGTLQALYTLYDEVKFLIKENTQNVEQEKEEQDNVTGKEENQDKATASNASDTQSAKEQDLSSQNKESPLTQEDSQPQESSTQAQELDKEQVSNTESSDVNKSEVESKDEDISEQQDEQQGEQADTLESQVASSELASQEQEAPSSVKQEHALDKANDFVSPFANPQADNQNDEDKNLNKLT
ncbi:hypothetical protein [Psittacicella hinzii]|uniref:Uncharacterized protein n=1 Tax=Psittacicella hinzii TaxID=2028575 RepID=A0A3A1YQN6_9GAMM|nr:hypothetical protein [Psittacicella hinzii]RIY39831.1 hypothetical protein CKF58_01575 [Psittacicella hinzii]